MTLGFFTQIVSRGCKPELLIVENTGQHPTTLSYVPSSGSSKITPNTQKGTMPTVRELWLQTVMGYWVDSFIKIERATITQQSSVKEVYKLWVRTQESLDAVFTTSATEITMPMTSTSEQTSPDACPSTGATISSAVDSTTALMGAVLGVQWHFDSAGDRVHLKIIS
jgi:hypothetical protein